MAELLKKFKCKTTMGEIQELSVYTTLIEATNEGEARQVKVEVEAGNFMTGYIGLTKDFDTPKASGINFKNGEEHWKMRKYMGVKNFSVYMQNNYPDTYKTIEIITDDMIPDTSDATNTRAIVANCTSLKEVTKEFDVRNSETIDTFCYSCTKLEKPIKFKNLEKIKNIASLYYSCGSLTEESDLTGLINCTNYSGAYRGTSITTISKINTASGVDFSTMLASTKITECTTLDISKAEAINGMFSQSTVETVDNLDTSNVKNMANCFWSCGKLKYLCPIDLSSMTLELIDTNMSGMLQFCSSLPSVTFNNVPIGVTEEQLRTATNAPSTCQIIINYREEV